MNGEEPVFDTSPCGFREVFEMEDSSEAPISDTFVEVIVAFFPLLIPLDGKGTLFILDIQLLLGETCYSDFNIKLTITSTVDIIRWICSHRT